MGCDGLLEAFDMANDAHTATADVIEAIECFHHFPEVIIAEGPEALVDEQRVHTEHFPCCARQGKGQGQRNHETLATREGIDRREVALQLVAHQDDDSIRLSL